MYYNLKSRRIVLPSLRGYSINIKRTTLSQKNFAQDIKGCQGNIPKEGPHTKLNIQLRSLLPTIGQTFQPTSRRSTFINHGGIREKARYQGLGNNYWALVGKFYLIRRVALILQFRTITFFDHYTTTALEESSMMWGCKNIVTTVF